MFIFRCTHWDPATRRCDSYESRPGMCRDYPRAHLWTGNPEFLPGCGYRAVAPGAAAMIAALRAEGLEGEKLEAVKRKLHLEE
jgi:Fe-S-cluster containining protein